MNDSLVQIVSTEEPAYNPLVYFEGWRVALLNDAPKFRKENIIDLQRHNTSDELFVLLEGSCTLYIGDGDIDSYGNIHTIEMEPNKLYNVRKSVWHNCVTNEGTKLLIVENADVSPDNSDYIPFKIS